MKIVSAREAIQTIKSGDTLVVGGAGAGHSVPDALLEALGRQFVETGTPKDITVLHPCGVGDNAERGLNHLAHEGLIKCDIGGFWGNAPKLCDLAKQNKLKGYNLPQGILTHLVRAAAGGESGLFSKTGLQTFVDPDVEGGKINDITTEDIVEKYNIKGEDYLFYRAIPMDVAFIRGTTADAEGNISMEEEVGTFSMLSLAQAVKVNGGIVIAQVKRVERNQHTVPVQVKIPGILVDFVVEAPDQMMTFLTGYDKALIDKTASFKQEELVLEGAKRLIARRAALDIFMARSISLVHTDADSPYGVLLAISIASSSVSNVRTERTGPKISSFAIFMSEVTSV